MIHLEIAMLVTILTLIIFLPLVISTFTLKSMFSKDELYEMGIDLINIES
jgi:uncharacterized protein with PQ loop repeat